MPTLGKDCHICISHTQVHGGLASGFLLQEQSGSVPVEGGAISPRQNALVRITREADSDGIRRMHMVFSVLLADEALNPDGSRRGSGRTAEYASLLEYLLQTEGLVVETSIGVFTNLGALGRASTELHAAGVSVVVCQLNNIGTFFPPADALLLSNSVWNGTLGWGGGYWR